MAFSIYMQNRITPAKYDEAIRKLNEAGAGAPRGRTYHSAFFEGETLSVIDVWDSMEDFEAFGAILLPILEEVGIEMVEPQVAQVHNIIAA